MKRLVLLAMSTLLLGFAAVASGQPPRDQAPQKPPGGRGGAARFRLGSLFPPPVRAELTLTPEQQKALAALEAEVAERLKAILTPEQKKQIEDLPLPGPPRDAPRKPGGRGGPPGEGGRKPPPPDRPREGEGSAKPQADLGGIAWFATLERGLAEAKRTGKPILFLSAAPSCGGVSGLW